MLRRGLAWAVIACAAAIVPAHADAPFITVQSTTSTENSGLFGHLLPLFTAATGIEVRVVAVGTGQAIKNAQNGDGDVLLVHAKADEEKFVSEGYGVARFDVMYNDFVVVGPAADEAKISGGKDAVAAFKTISDAKAPFVSRGDDSGTHKAELKIWSLAGVDVKAQSGTWYREAGQGMGATLNMAAGLNAYVLSDRATWSAFKNKAALTIVLEGDTRLHNPYGVILVNPAKNANVKAKEGQAFIDWLLSDAGQRAIGEFRINGEQQFFPAARR
ncbi:MAG: substrate-binding domain-containing protein [Hyphomicrobium sp.]